MTKMATRQEGENGRVNDDSRLLLEEIAAALADLQQLIETHLQVSGKANAPHQSASSATQHYTEAINE